MYCKNCGCLIHEQDSFCENCGNPVSDYLSNTQDHKPDRDSIETIQAEEIVAHFPHEEKVEANMQKTRLGISIGALAAITYFAGFFSGFLVAVVLAGYVLLFEENNWLRRSVVKAVVLIAFFAIITAALNLIPDAIGFLGNIISVFGGNFDLLKIRQIIIVFTSGISILEKILFLGLGIKALSKKTIVIPFIDLLVSKYMN